MEWHIDTLEWDGGKSTLKLQRLWFQLGLFGAFANNPDQMFFDVLKGHLLRQSLNIDLLNFEVIGDVGQAIQGTKLIKVSLRTGIPMR